MASALLWIDKCTNCVQLVNLWLLWKLNSAFLFLFYIIYWSTVWISRCATRPVCILAVPIGSQDMSTNGSKTSTDRNVAGSPGYEVIIGLSLDFRKSCEVVSLLNTTLHSDKKHGMHTVVQLVLCIQRWVRYVYSSQIIPVTRRT